MDRGHSGLILAGAAYKYCDKVCYSQETLVNHINNAHDDRQSFFQCAFCGRKFNDFRLYNAHLELHSRDMYYCYLCNEKFKDAVTLKIHVPTHIKQCPFCSRTFESLKVLGHHVNTAHGTALPQELKKCAYCDAVFNMADELGKHSKEQHRYCFYDICFAGFVSEPLLVEHHVSDHTDGCPGKPGERVPSTPKMDLEIQIIKVTDPEVEQVMQIIQTPEPDPFADKWHPAIGQIKWDNKYKFKCEECSGYLKNSNMRIMHVMHFHPLVLYKCHFCAQEPFYTRRDFLRHCKSEHLLCTVCEIFLRNKDDLQDHNSTHHQPVEAPVPQPGPPAATSLPRGTEVPKDEPDVPTADNTA